MKIKTLILGAGIGGLAAGTALKQKGETDFLILEKAPSLPMNLHNGLHYLHSNDFGTPFSFSFKSVIISEEVWNVRKDEFSKCANLPQMFDYSKKLMENLRHPSSIMDPGKMQSVFVPESNNMNDLIQAYFDYIGPSHFEFNMKVDTIEMGNKILKSGKESYEYENIISTLPINLFYGMCELKSPYEFKSKKIYIHNYVTRNIVPNWLIVLYISDPKFPPYRMTVMNNILSMESVVPMTYEDKVIVKYHTEELFDYNLDSEQMYEWETGRIFGLSKEEREIMVKSFSDKDIHLVGRWANWNGKLIMDSTILQAKQIVNKL